MEKIDIFGFTLDNLKEEFKEKGFPSFRAGQIYKWLYEKGIFDFHEMTDIANSDRDKLHQLYNADLFPNTIKHKSKIDKSIKYAFGIDNTFVESVFMPEKGRVTVCLSSQSGCALKCVFCSTGQKKGRNLESFEIIKQFMSMQKNSERRITNVVFMGMGEPFLNYDNVMNAVEILNSDNGIRIGARKITLSTAGIIPGIKRLKEFPLQVKLAVSLNSAIQKKREALMPIAKTYELPDLKKAIIDYQKVKNKMMTFEYILIPEINNGREDVDALFKFIDGIDAKVNIIPLNRSVGNFKEPTKSEIESFMDKLYPMKDAVTLRESRGRDISGACGQLSGNLS